MNTIADHLRDAAKAMQVAEERLDYLLDDIFGENEWNDSTYDDYDNSIEVYGLLMARDWTTKRLQKLWDAGFSRCWLHDKETGKEYYCQAPKKDADV